MHVTIRSFLLIMFTSFWVTAQATVPTNLSYQAYLSDYGGVAIDGNTVITFAIYTADFGGAPLWMDTELVEVDQGLFSVELGGPGSPFPPGLFNTPLWLGVTIDGDTEMLPRRPLTSVGFAFKADDALSLQGQGPASFDQAAHVTDTGNPHGVTAAQAGAASSADIVNLQTQLDSAVALIAQLQVDFGNEVANRIADVNAEEAARIADVDMEEIARLAADTLQDASISNIETNSVLALDGMLSLSGGNTALFDGVNVQVVNGTGTTDGTPNGAGNLIVGYDEQRTTGDPVCSDGRFEDEIGCGLVNGVWSVDHKSGSHNVVIGPDHNYSQYGGLVAGLRNTINGGHSAVTGGRGNIAGNSVASVSGGVDNTAVGIGSSVSGGTTNRASQLFSSVSGGRSNHASFFYASINGGYLNAASGESSSVSGGQSNVASGRYASISGGSMNIASGGWSAVLGGGAFSLGNEAYSDFSAILGGVSNRTGDTSSGDRTIGSIATVSGGRDNTASGDFSSVGGGDFLTCASSEAMCAEGSVTPAD